MKRWVVTVYLTTDDETQVKDVQNYIQEAVSSWKGQLFPGYTDPYPNDPPDPMWNTRDVGVLRPQLLPK